ncbi:hypothetical protein M408DRAFT_26051 [Serendipita vermifera MAFF 305830]|uniref:Uncharacterized protein n=1 Tax=Serendipita vermifera MAFF 305830 TaxID=933852 RepID=A0A0C2WGF2_SERVB|nr:hypothetical protein M408DRAFT_26051 [Serendipita vermifera MAFF 305830]
MLILLLAYHIAQSVQSEAGPIPALLEQRDVVPRDDQNNQRPIWSIIWSCLSTIFLCTWVAVHPNVHFKPEKHNQRWFEKWLWDPLHEFFTYKLLLFVWALLVPEYILAWAVRQYIQAGVISRQVPGWTRTHGFFMVMGGFHLFRLPTGASFIPLPHESSKPSEFVVASGRHLRQDEVPVCPLKFEDFSIDVLEIIVPTETELKDRGKSDALTKLIVLVQTLWFIVQCIARGTQHLPLTELEVVTLAYAMLNLFIYGFWWDKPRNVECPIRLYKASTTTHKESGEEAEEWETNQAERWWQKVITYTLGAQDAHVTLSSEHSTPMFWSGRIPIKLLGDAGLGPTILGAVFGAIHCIAWSSEFPSRSELVLWRVSCISMIAVPFITTIFLAFMAISWRTEEHSTDWMMVIGLICAVLLILSAWLYVAGRLATLVIAFSTLRAPPPAVFVNVDWTAFIPHIY